MSVERTVRVNLVAATGAYNQAMRQSGHVTAGASRQMGGMQGQAGGLLMTMRRFAPALLGAGGVVRGIQHVTRSQANFADSTLRLRTQIGLTTQQSEELAAASREVGRAYGVGAQQAIDASWFIASAGLRGQDATEALEASAQAAAVGFGEMQTVADLVTSAMNAYGPEVLSASRATDILGAAVREGKAQPEELAASMGQVLPIASEMGVSFEELAGVVAAMTRTGTNAATANIQMRQVLMDLLNPSQQARDTLEEFGLSAEGLRKQIREEGLLAVLMTLRDSFGDNEEAMSNVFGNARSLMGVLDLLGANADENAKIVENVADSFGLMDEAMQEVEDTSVEFQWNRLKANLHDIFLGSGEAADGLRGLLSIMNDFLDFDPGDVGNIGGVLRMFIDPQASVEGARHTAARIARDWFGIDVDLDAPDVPALDIDMDEDAVLRRRELLRGAMNDVKEAIGDVGDEAEGTTERLIGSMDAWLDSLDGAGDQWVDVAAQFLDANQALDRALEENREAAQAAADAHNEATDGASKSWQDFADDFPPTVAQVTGHLEDINQEFRDWQGDIATIAQRAGSDVATRLAMMGPEWAPIVADAVDATAEELAALDAAMADNIDLQMAAAEMAVQMQVLEEVARQGGNATVESVAEALGAAPEVVNEIFSAIGRPTIDVDANVDGAIDRLRDLERAAIAASMDRSLVVQVSQSGTLPSSGGNVVVHDGGLIVPGGVRRMHSGGLAGDEVPAILQTGEFVLSRGMLAGSQPVPDEILQAIGAGGGPTFQFEQHFHGNDAATMSREAAHQARLEADRAA